MFTSAAAVRHLEEGLEKEGHVKGGLSLVLGFHGRREVSLSCVERRPKGEGTRSREMGSLGERKRESIALIG